MTDDIKISLSSFLLNCCISHNNTYLCHIKTSTPSEFQILTSQTLIASSAWYLSPNFLDFPFFPKNKAANVSQVQFLIK